MAVYVQSVRDMMTSYLAFIDNVTYASASPAQIAAALQALNDGYRRYLSGEYVNNAGDSVTYVWSFVKADGEITLVTDDADYDLPDDYQGDIDQYTYDSNTLTRGANIEIVDHPEMMALRRDYDDGALPRKCTVRAKAFTVAAGTSYEWLPYPVPTATENGLTINYHYRKAMPALANETDEYPAGLIGCGDLIVQAARAIEEHDSSGQDGSETARYYRYMNEMVIRDRKVIPGALQQKTLDVGSRNKWRSRR